MVVVSRPTYYKARWRWFPSLSIHQHSLRERGGSQKEGGLTYKRRLPGPVDLCRRAVTDERGETSLSQSLVTRFPIEFDQGFDPFSPSPTRPKSSWLTNSFFPSLSFISDPVEKEEKKN